MDDFSSGAITAEGFDNAKILKLDGSNSSDGGSVLVPFKTKELELLISEHEKRMELLKASDDYPEEKYDKVLLERLKTARYYSSFKICPECGIIYYTLHPLSECKVAKDDNKRREEYKKEYSKFIGE